MLCAGRHSGPKDYSVEGSSATKAFDAMGALGTMAFAFNTVILPEIQVSQTVCVCVAEILLLIGWILPDIA